jgi:predicted trehalose synthase
MRPLAERALPDQWIRDVAGMLRSLDYCGGAWELDNPGSARPWVTAAQTAFLQGYAVASGVDPLTHEALLTAFELDKAMYEVVYEARNRPDWVSIPLAAIDRLTAGHDAQKESP